MQQVVGLGVGIDLRVVPVDDLVAVDVQHLCSLDLMSYRVYPVCMTEATSAPDTPEAITRTSVLAFFAADHIAVSENKMYVNGGFFNLLRFPVFPATLATLGIGVVLQIPFHDTMHNHVFRIGMRGPEHQELPVRIEGQFRATPSPEAEFGEPNIAPFGVTIPNVQIPTPGAYQLELSLDHQLVATYRMRAFQVPMVMTVGSPSAAPLPEQ